MQLGRPLVRNVVSFRFVLCVLFALSLAQRSAATLIINEVMANEPGSDLSLEWIELHNDAGSSTNLSFYTLQIGVAPIPLPALNLPARGYLVICRDTAAFKLFWQEGAERTNTILSQTTFSLNNSLGTLYLITAGIDTAQFQWNSSGADGVSWEREQPTLNLISQSIDKSGSTGGFANSHTLLPRDLVLQSVIVQPAAGLTTITATIENRSLGTASGSRLFLFAADSSDTTFEGALFAAEDIPPVDSGFVTVVNLPLTLPGNYQYLGARLTSDDRIRNNRIDKVVPGAEFPTLRLNECLVNPEPLLFSEWIEIRNNLDLSVSLQGWQIGDALGSAPLTVGNEQLGGNAYLVAVQNESNFRAYYTAYTGELIQPPNWSALNDNADIVRLIDPYGYEADRFSYQSAYDNNETWSRSEDVGSLDEWGRSPNSGGSPGVRNETRLVSDTSGLSLILQPQIFSPDGDGRDDSLLLIIDPPAAKGYRLRIFDRSGRIVRSFLDGEPDFRGSYSWDGRESDGGRLPTGIYIVVFEAIQVESIKKTVVIAR